jgi:hypothetical protein
MQQVTPLENQIYRDYLKQGILAFDSKPLKFGKKEKTMYI